MHHGAQLSSLPKMHLSKLSTCRFATKTWPSVSRFNHATFLCHASPGTPERAKDIPLRCLFFPYKILENGSYSQKQHRSTFCHVWTWFCCPTSQRYLRQAETSSMNVIHLKFPSQGTAITSVLITKWCTKEKKIRQRKDRWLKRNRINRTGS